jgi:hypothetical protein
MLPQTPAQGSEWEERFPVLEPYVHKLGNLVLLTRKENSQSKNFDFQKKKNSYFRSRNGVTNFALTTQVIQEKEWTIEVLERRQVMLIGLLMDEWKLNEFDGI